MATRIGLTIPSLSGPSIPEQDEIIGSLVDIKLTVDHPTFRQLTEECRKENITLSLGDRIILADSSVFTRSTEDLVNLIATLVRRGIGVQFVCPDLTFDTADQSLLARKTIDLLDRQWRAAARERQLLATQSAAPPGRPRRLTPEQIRRIPALMAEPGATSDSVARQLNISRATLYRYLTREEHSTNKC